MDNISVLEQALNLLPLTVTVDDKAVKEAVISHLAQEVCLHLRQHFPTSSFDIAEDSMKQALATGRAGSPEVSSSNQSGASASGSAGSLGVQDFMNPDILKTAKLWRFQKLSRGYGEE
ncbi:TPA: hypothetical protein ACH3X3_006315 [Trebouxia sp. C0006]